MPRRTNLQIGLVGDRDLSGQIHRRIRQAILDGLLESGQALPSTRELAAQLAVSRTTVGTAYDKLMAEGLVRGRPGVGTFVSNASQSARHPSHDATHSPLRPARLWSTIPAAHAASSTSSNVFDLRPGVPDPRLFPFATWRALVSRYTNATVLLDRSGADVAGHARLRKALAQHIGVFRAMRARPEDVYLTNGAQQAVELAARVLLEPGEAVAVEEPGHRDIRALFTSMGLQVVPVPVDAEGAVIDAIPAGVRCVHICPARQFPLGMTMSAERRHAALAWAERVDGVIIEDDYDGEFPHTGRPVDPLHSLDRSGRVVHVGSWARLLFPGVRIGYVVAPSPLHEALQKAKQILDPHPSAPVQLAAAAFVDEGHLARHIRRMRPVYAERHHRMVTVALETLRPYVVPMPSTTGLDVPVIFRDATVDGTRVARRASEFGVGVTAISDVSTSGRHSGLLLGFGGVAVEHIDEGLARLRTSIETAPSPIEPAKDV